MLDVGWKDISVPGYSTGLRDASIKRWLAKEKNSLKSNSCQFPFKVSASSAIFNCTQLNYCTSRDVKPLAVFTLMSYENPIRMSCKLKVDIWKTALISVFYRLKMFAFHGVWFIAVTSTRPLVEIVFAKFGNP